MFEVGFAVGLSFELTRYTRAMIRTAVGYVLLSVSGGILAQSTIRIDAPKAQGEIVSAFHVIYPPIATAARVSGDVKLVVHLRADGTPSDVSVVSGPQMLRAVALEGAQKNEYLCHSCTESGADLNVTFSFRLGPAVGCGNGGIESSYQRFSYCRDSITIEAQPYLICDPGAQFFIDSEDSITIETQPPLIASPVASLPSRSAKCLFLWRCGWSRPHSPREALE